MTDGKVIYRIFLSSPGDVTYERTIVRQEAERIFDEPDLSSRFDCEIVSWDDPDHPSPLLANQTPQATLRRQLVEPADCDLVITILWSRIGTPLPKAEFRKANGEAYLSGTEWEFENALTSPNRPHILLYRRIDTINLDPESGEYETALQQQGSVNQFFKRFHGNDGALNGLYRKYKGTSEFREQLEQDLRGVLRLDVAEGAGDADRIRVVDHKPTWHANPYVGLAPYDEEHAEVFFGRETEIQRLEEKIVNRASCIAVVGASGVGKSSLVLAGLVPRLKKSAALGGEPWVCKTTKPSNTHFLNEFFGAETQQDIDDAVDAMLVEALPAARLVMVIDQAEELLKLDKGAIPAFAKILDGLIQCPRACLVLTCRSDLYGDFVAVSGSELQSYLQESTFMVSAPRPADMIDIVRKPAQAAGIVVEDEVVGNILEKFERNGDALPLISYLLGKLYEAVGEERVFDLEAYEAAGGVEGVVKASAENIYTSLTPREAARFSDAFARLLSIDDHDRVTREHCALSVFQQEPEMEALINAFVGARLLTITKDDSGVSTVEIAHESLVYNWPSLASLARERSGQIKWRKSLREAARRWKEGGMPDTRLMQGVELDRAIDIEAKNDIKPEPVEKEFLEASKLRRSDIEKKIRRLGYLPLGVIVLSFVMIIYATAQIYSEAIDSMLRQQGTMAQETATSVGLSLSVPMGNKDYALVKSIINAYADRGNYAVFRVTDDQGRVVAESANRLPSNRTWLSEWISIPAAPAGTARLMSGWQPGGEISVEIKPVAVSTLIDAASKRYPLIAGIFLLAVVLVYWFSRKALRRLRKSVS